MNYKKLSKTFCTYVQIELNNENKILFLDIFIDTNNNTFTTFPYKELTRINMCILNYKSECPNYINIAIIQNLINHAKKKTQEKNFLY